ncbi:hypothetical protein B0H14DRAFT_2622553 [Mycena olivaceomarginata]|nr:hypothetical protein B0H14DRAFT_2622553 [Mycena olivaceomarginata]
MYLPLVLNPRRVIRSDRTTLTARCTTLTARLGKERLIVPVCPPRRAHRMSRCQRKVDAKGSIAPGSPASPAEVDNMHPSGRVDAGRIGRSVFEIKKTNTAAANVYKGNGPTKILMLPENDPHQRLGCHRGDAQKQALKQASQGPRAGRRCISVRVKQAET